MCRMGAGRALGGRSSWVKEGKGHSFHSWNCNCTLKSSKPQEENRQNPQQKSVSVLCTNSPSCLLACKQGEHESAFVYSSLPQFAVKGCVNTVLNYLLMNATSLVQGCWDIFVRSYLRQCKIRGNEREKDLPRSAIRIWRIPIIRATIWSSDILGRELLVSEESSRSKHQQWQDRWQWSGIVVIRLWLVVPGLRMFNYFKLARLILFSKACELRGILDYRCGYLLLTCETQRVFVVWPGCWLYIVVVFRPRDPPSVLQAEGQFL